MSILVIGASGHVGGSVVAQLSAAGQRVRAASRNPESVALPEGAEPVAVDLTAPDSLAPALHGVRRVFTYAVPEAMADLARAARDAGVEHVVLLSSVAADPAVAAGMGPDVDEIVRRHVVSERALTGSGLAWTFLRPGGFATNAKWWAPSIRGDGVVRMPFPEGQTTPIHEHDMAAVAVRALTEDGHDGNAYWLTGPESLSQRAQLDAIADAIGTPIRLEEVSADQAGPEYPPSLVRHFANAGARPQEVSPVTERLLGRKGLTFARWAVDHADDFR
ncbi:SDR family oxidoreductase [Pseudonocardia acaciae]|uniref:SDR family oxidoreductase n=1 Tax=Pseudonocardia acaciae TaxID=551276 RepID=UPI0004905473|nr:NAD(P)H-binding protein [Pseudonocardia acaciae]